jgi:hypothetical protein
MSGRSSGFMARLGGGSDSLGAVHGQDRYWSPARSAPVGSSPADVEEVVTKAPYYRRQRNYAPVPCRRMSGKLPTCLTKMSYTTPVRHRA